MLARPPSTISVADVLRAVDGPLAAVRDEAPDELVYGGAGRNLPAVWREVHSCLGTLLDHVSMADLVAGKFDASLNMTDWSYFDGTVNRRPVPPPDFASVDRLTMNDAWVS